MKKAPITPVAVVLKCIACQEVAPGGVISGATHKNCPKKGPAKPSRFMPPPVVHAALLAKFRPMKAVAGNEVGGTAIKLADEPTKTGAGNPSQNAESVWAQAHKWTGSAWQPITGRLGEQGGLHAEQNAWRSVNGANRSDCWIGFVQNAPPCGEKCFSTFLDASESCKGIVFFITGDKGYCREYAELVNGAAPVPPFAIYMWKGLWSIDTAISDAPTESAV